MNIEHLREFKKRFENDPAAAREALEGALEELGELNKKGDRMTPLEVKRAGYLLDLADFLEEPQGGPVPGGFGHGDGSVGYGPLSEDERCYRIGRQLQAIAASAMPPGDKIGGFSTGTIAPELRASGQVEQTPSLGGFLVGSDLATSIFQKVQKYGQLLRRCRQVPLSGNSNKLEWPTVDEVSRADGSRFGGVRGYWGSEAASLTSSSFKFGKLELSLNKVHCLAYSSSELLQDAAALGSFVEEAFASELTFKIEDGLINGSGAGRPLGLLQSPALISVAAASSAGTLVAADLVSMFGRFWASSQDNAVFLANQDTIPKLLVLNTDVNFTGQGAPLFFPSMTKDPVMRLFGKPILFMEQCQTCGTAGDIILVDPTQILVATKGSMAFATSGHVQFVTDELAFRATWRLDAQPMWSAPLSPFKGSNSQSPYVTVATRT